MGSLSDLWNASLRLLTGVAPAFFPAGFAEKPDPDSHQATWLRRYLSAMRRLQRAGIQTVADEQAGADRYVSLRSQWDHYIRAYTHFMAYDVHEIDPAGSNPPEVDDRQAYRTPLRSAG